MIKFLPRINNALSNEKAVISTKFWDFLSPEDSMKFDKNKRFYFVYFFYARVSENNVIIEADIEAENGSNEIKFSLPVERFNDFLNTIAPYKFLLNKLAGG